MRFSSRVIAGSLLGLLLASAGTLPSTAQTNAPSAIDFGDDSSPWAKDGECDDPRFEGSGVADEVVDADLLKDATDCSAAFDAGTAILKAEDGTARPPAPTATPSAPTAPVARAEIDFGDDSSQWANDGECDDPRFTGAGAAAELVDEDRLKDATDCRAAYEAGTVIFGEQSDGDTAAQPMVRPEIDFGDDSSKWANDGECDDPRFTGAGAAAELVDEDRLKDATDCRAAYEAGTVTFGEQSDGDTAAQPMVRPEIDFGDDSSKWANDGECDDPRFTGAGAAAELVDEDRLKDATDCRAAYEAGTVTFSDEADGGVAAQPLADADIVFGDDSSEWANDGECDDPRFTGTGVARETLAADIRRDASDCRAAYEAGTAQFQGEKSAMAFDFGSDFSRWANDGECDDLRFTGPGVDKKLLAEDLMGDATDCKALLDEGQISIRAVYSPEYAAGAPYDSSEIDFGDNSSSYADDGECDDPRFEGPGTATTLLESDRLADANDCKAAFEAGTIMLVDSES
ncbi:hypothetical protein [Devosia sp. FJ2-5-3]|uniref:hypothetical protein n=1 Tax=Devosia sp. FJ2-5-3 TaxID=2976680 RepID=UPI0023D84C6B|nr:hypothetical protein [Devosia sp. FJ2-5-3]WEJ58755.1 hypothetical protein N0P34_01625 [Devosia sp. FJ2-5-3]